MENGILRLKNVKILNKCKLWRATMSNKNKILNRDKEEKQKLINEINRAQLDVKTAQLFFEYVSDTELVDVAIYELEAKNLDIDI